MDDFITVKSKENIELIALYIKNYCKIERDKNEIYIDEKYLYSAFEALAEFLIRNCVFFFVNELISDDALDLSYNEKFDIINSINEAVLDEEYNLIELVKNDLIQLAREYRKINLDGFLTFTFRKYKDKIFDILSDVIVSAKVREEYREMIDLLSEYISEFPPEYESLNIITQPDNTYKYFNADKKDITEECRKIVVDRFEICEYNPDDELMSIAICMLPTEIIFHNHGNFYNQNLVHTLKSIFGNRFIICTEGCSFCGL